MSSLYCLRDYLRIPDGSTSGYGNTITRDRLGFEFTNWTRNNIQKNAKKGSISVTINLFCVSDTVEGN